MKPRIIVIAGPTGSGKSALGEALGRRFGGEIISADCRQVYRGLDLGSGKEQLTVPQHLIDICEPGERFTAADWRALAAAEIESLIARGRLPLVVGGTNLYISALLDNYEFAPEQADLRAALASATTDELVAELQKTNPSVLADLDPRNRRYLERAVEKTRLGWRGPRRGESPYEALVLWCDWPRVDLYARIDRRLTDRMQAGLLEEVRGLLARGVDPSWLRGLGLEYRYLTDYLEGRYESQDEAVTRLAFASHAFARRQTRWWRRRPKVDVDRADLEEAERLVADWQEVSI